MRIHPSDELLEDLFHHVGEERLDLFFHVLHCSYCRGRLHYLPRLDEEALAEEDGEYDAAFTAGLKFVRDKAPLFERERLEAPALLVEMLSQPAERWETLVRAELRFQTWGVLELMVERSWEMTTRDPLFAEELGRLALVLANFLDISQYGAGLIEDLRARAWGYIGNSRRTRSDLRGAEEAFAKASTYLPMGTGDPTEQAILLDLIASLRRDQRRFGEAENLLNDAITTFSRFGDKHRAGRCLVNLSTVYEHLAQPERSIPVLFRALDLIDPSEQPRLLLCARHNLMTNLVDVGRCSEAWEQYQKNRPLYRNFAEPWVQNRRKWVKAKIVRGLGQTDQASKLFLAARDGFIAEGIPYDTALVSLELATVYAEQGRTAELKRLAEEMFPIFASRHIHREALAALTFFQQAVETETATLEMVERVASFLKKAQNDPEMRFERGE